LLLNKKNYLRRIKKKNCQYPELEEVFPQVGKIVFLVKHQIIKKKKKEKVME